MLEVVSEFMQVVAPDQRFVVAGGSYGAYLARGMINQQGGMIDGLYLIVPLIVPDDTLIQLPPQQTLVADEQYLAALSPQESYLRDLFVIQSLETLELFRNLTDPTMEAPNPNYLQKIREQFAFSFPVDNLPTPFPAPALIITGRQDSICGYFEAWKTIENYPRATFAVLDRAGHLLHFEQQSLYQ